jgi:galactoside O-acetyltransferase
MDMSAFGEVGWNVRIFPLAKVLSPETVKIGSHVIIDDFVFLGAHRQLLIGNHVHIASHASITGGGECLVCDFAGMSSGARILTGTDDFWGGGLTGPTVPSEFRKVSRGRVVVGRHVVIGANAVVLPDVVIGEGAVVGAGGIVTKNLEPWGVYVGAPVRRVASRKSEVILRYESELLARQGPYPRYFSDLECLKNDSGVH